MIDACQAREIYNPGRGDHPYKTSGLRRRGFSNPWEQRVLAIPFCMVALGALELVLANALSTQQKSGIHIQVSDTLAFARTPGIARMVPVLVAEGQVHLCVARHLGTVES